MRTSIPPIIGFVNQCAACRLVNSLGTDLHVSTDVQTKTEQLAAAGISTTAANEYEQLAAPDAQRGAFTSHWRFLRERRRERLRPAYTSKRDSCQPVLAGHRRQ
jgi:hypothetical protein